MFVWEVGAIATILAAIMAVLVAVSLTRAAEDDERSNSCEQPESTLGFRFAAPW